MKGDFMKKLEPLLDLLGEIIALTMVVVYILALANAQWGFIESKTILNIMKLVISQKKDSNQITTAHIGKIKIIMVLGLTQVDMKTI